MLHVTYTQYSCLPLDLRPFGKFCVSFLHTSKFDRPEGLVGHGAAMYSDSTVWLPVDVCVQGGQAVYTRRVVSKTMNRTCGDT